MRLKERCCDQTNNTVGSTKQFWMEVRCGLWNEGSMVRETRSTTLLRAPFNYFITWVGSIVPPHWVNSVSLQCKVNILCAPRNCIFPIPYSWLIVAPDDPHLLFYAIHLVNLHSSKWPWTEKQYLPDFVQLSITFLFIGIWGAMTTTSGSRRCWRGFKYSLRVRISLLKQT